MDAMGGVDGHAGSAGTSAHQGSRKATRFRAWAQSTKSPKKRTHAIVGVETGPILSSEYNKDRCKCHIKGSQ
jgi:hypothetical protein